MGKSEWRKRRREREEKARRLQRAKDKLAPYKVEANQTCGCCSTTLAFKSKASARAAFQKAGLTSFGTITDDLGQVHEGVDTFYGFRLADEKPRSIPWLLGTLTGKSKWPA